MAGYDFDIGILGGEAAGLNAAAWASQLWDTCPSP